MCCRCLHAQVPIKSLLAILILTRLGPKVMSPTVSMLLQGQLADAQQQHQEAISTLHSEKQEEITKQERVRQQLTEKEEALAASQKALAAATAAAAAAITSQVNLEHLPSLTACHTHAIQLWQT